MPRWDMYYNNKIDPLGNEETSWSDSTLMSAVWIFLCFIHTTFPLMSILAAGSSRPIFTITIPSAKPITTLWKKSNTEILVRFWQKSVWHTQTCQARELNIFFNITIKKTTQIKSTLNFNLSPQELTFLQGSRRRCWLIMQYLRFQVE